ncbi:MAG: EF-hand domain-containing protein, partial [Pirellulaceae bacterium]|nr:EF-hand domain-containing protein [Pirellulaceae bacterium]
GAPGERPAGPGGATTAGGAPGGPRPGGGNFDPAAIFQQRDADGDGKLTGDEISDRMRENLSAIDSDGDGSITLEEFQARMRQFSGGQGGGPGGGGPGGGGPGGGGPAAAQGGGQ